MNAIENNQKEFEDFCKQLTTDEYPLNIQDYESIQKLITTAFNYIDKTEYDYLQHNTTRLRKSLEVKINKEFEKISKEEQQKSFLQAVKEKIIKSPTLDDIKNYIIDSIELERQKTHGIKAKSISNLLQLRRSGSFIQVVCPDSNAHIGIPTINNETYITSNKFQIKVEKIRPNNYDITISSIIKLPNGETQTTHITPLEVIGLSVSENDTSYCLIYKKATNAVDRINFDGHLQFEQNRLLNKYHIKKNKPKKQKPVTTQEDSPSR